MEIVVLFVFLAIALLGWGCGVVHDRLFSYHPLESELETPAHGDYAIQEEMSLKDILKTNSTKGFDAI